MEALRRNFVDSAFSRVRAGAEIVQDEARALERLSKRMPADFSAAVELLVDCTGAAIVTGIGKAGWIGQKISASLASTGTRSHFLHPTEAMHGDLGRIGPDDVVIALSNSGETDELLRILPVLEQRGVPMIAITADASSSLGQAARHVLDYGRVAEAGHLALAPSTTTTVMLALGDALALVVSQVRSFSARDFAQHHPGGTLGRRLASVNELMRPISHCRLARAGETVREIYVRSSVAERRVGVILVTAENGTLAGVFTDSDLARLLERRRDIALDREIGDVMTVDPISITSGATVAAAIDILAGRTISELPVVDSNNRPIGLIDITDVIGLLPGSA